MPKYCPSRYTTIRRHTTEQHVGNITIGGNNPIRVQSMTTTNTQDVEATVKQTLRLVDAGCEIVRITAPNKAAALALKDIRAQLDAAKVDVPLVADIHFLPNAAMTAVEFVEKVRVNPGNYADNKKFATREYSDSQYDEELQRLHDSFSPLVIRAKELGRSLRIGTNHGSLSDRIMNRYGDTPLGMVESALEFLRIAESHNFQNIGLSMKASNPKVMIEAYRMLVERMDQEKMLYPLHLGVTEAGDGEDGRIKSAIGIGSLLLDGLGDTIRVSLTEDPEFEIPVARALADKVMKLWNHQEADTRPNDSIDPYHFEKRPIETIELGKSCTLHNEQPPSVIFNSHTSLSDTAQLVAKVKADQARLIDTPIEGILVKAESVADLDHLDTVASRLANDIAFLLVDLDPSIASAALKPVTAGSLAYLRDAHNISTEDLTQFLQACQSNKATPFLALTAEDITKRSATLQSSNTVITLSTAAHGDSDDHAIGAYRLLAEALKTQNLSLPIWIRNTVASSIQHDLSFLSRLLEGSILSGSLLCDGLGNLISMETEKDLKTSIKLAYNILQGAGARITKTEFVACPSCGRTLFDLQSTTQRIREQTGHLKGVKIAIMGCIVNGPGEMADADFGYVGGAPGKINLYVGKECVKFNIPAAEADQRLIDLIKTHNKWIDAPAPIV